MPPASVCENCVRNENVMNSALGLEYLLGNVDIAKHLLQFLSYKEQLNIARVCKQFENTVINFIWKLKYQNIEIIARQVVYALSHNLESLTDNWKLTLADELESFLCLNYCNIKKIKIWGRFGFESDRMYQQIPLNHQFLNLTSLNYVGIMLEEKDLLMLSDNCRNLNTLIIEDCVNYKKQVLVVGMDINVITIAKIRKLKSFVLKSNHVFSADMHMHNFGMIQNLLRNLNIPKLHINVAIISDADAVHENVHDCAMESMACQDLEIGQFHIRDDFTHFCKKLLPLYTNLQRLTVRGMLCCTNIPLSTDFFDTIKNSLNNLTQLNLSDCAISDLWPLNTLHELSLYSCGNLTHECLKEILSSNKLRSLQKLEVDFKERPFVKLLEQNLPNLKSLVWRSECSEILPLPSLYMKNIEKMDVSRKQIANIEDLLSLRSLHTLRLSNSDIHHILELLQHPSLRYLTIASWDKKVGETSLAALSDSFGKELKTNIMFLDIPIDLFESFQDVWLNIISTNRYMKLVARGSNILKMNNSFFSDLIHSKNFPARTRSIRLCGFNIDCSDFRSSYIMTIKKIEIIKMIMTFSAKEPTVVFSDT